MLRIAVPEIYDVAMCTYKCHDFVAISKHSKHAFSYKAIRNIRYMYDDYIALHTL